MPSKRPPVPKSLTRDELNALWSFAKKHFPRWATKARIEFIAGETLDYHRGIKNRHRYEDWLAVCRNRIRYLEARGWDPFKSREQEIREREMPQEPRGKQTESDLTPIGDVIQLFKNRGATG
jgi:hypothetical protein